MELLLLLGGLVALDILAVTVGHDSRELDGYALQEYRVRRPSEERWRLWR